MNIFETEKGINFKEQNRGLLVTSQTQSSDIWANLSDTQREDIYNMVCADHVYEDSYWRLLENVDMPEDVLETLSKEIANDYVYNHNYDSALSYWDNIDNLVKKYLEPQEREMKEFCLGLSVCFNRPLTKEDSITVEPVVLHMNGKRVEFDFVEHEWYVNEVSDDEVYITLRYPMYGKHEQLKKLTIEDVENIQKIESVEIHTLDDTLIPLCLKTVSFVFPYASYKTVVVSDKIVETYCFSNSLSAKKDWEKLYVKGSEPWKIAKRVEAIEELLQKPGISESKIKTLETEKESLLSYLV